MADTTDKEVKLGHGKYSNIDTALTSGTLDANDLVVTSDTSELVYITDDKQKQRIRGRIRTYENYADAVNDLTSPSTYEGELISAKDINGIPIMYTVASDGSGGYKLVTPTVSTASTTMRWVEF